MGCGACSRCSSVCRIGCGVSSSLVAAFKSNGVRKGVDHDPSRTYAIESEGKEGKEEQFASLFGPSGSGSSGASCSTVTGPEEFQGILTEDIKSSTWGTMTAEGQQVKCEQMILITDIGQDNDDEMALLLLGELARKGEVQVLAVVANLRPANRRAALARGTLDTLGMANVPVGIGTDGGSENHSDTFSSYISKSTTGVDYFSIPWEDVQELEKVMGTAEEEAMSQKIRVHDGQKLLVKTLREAADKSVRLVLISSLKDVAMCLRNNEELFKAKIKGITIMGGVDVPGEVPFNARASRWHLMDNVPPRPPGRLLEPSDAHNNVFDMASSKFFYQRCQELGLPMTVVSRFTAYACPVKKYVYDLMVRCPVPHPIVCRLQRAQRTSIETLWHNVCAGGVLPARCDKLWFCDTFCGGRGADRGGGDSMWDLIVSFNMYDPLAIIAALPDRRDVFFEPTLHHGADSSMHRVIGESKDKSGIVSGKVDDLHDFMMTTWIRAASASWHDKFTRRPSLLDEVQLTAALSPMTKHSPEDVKQLNKSVLRLIDEEWPLLKNSSLLTTWRERDKLMKSIGPEMQLVDPETIQLLGRIPHSAEGKTISLEMAAQRAKRDNKRFFIEMFSHRWHTPYAPDDQYFNKAKVLCEWAKYRDSMNFRTFFWIDYACINQSDIGPGVSMLPLYTSCCNNIVCYDSVGYWPRAWCRVERLMFAAFVAPNNEVVDPDFFYRPDAEKLPSGELKPSYDGKILVPDPSAIDAELSFPSDVPVITRLRGLCTEHWAKCWKDGLMDVVIAKVGLKEIQNLRYGFTEVRIRRYV